MGSGPGIYYYEDREGRWRWALAAANNRVVADSGYSYDSKSAAEAGLGAVVRILQDPLFHDHLETPPGYS